MEEMWNLWEAWGEKNVRQTRPFGQDDRNLDETSGPVPSRLAKHILLLLL